MAKAVFRPNELINVPDMVVISAPASFVEIDRFATVEDEPEIVKEDEYSGPTADDLRREAEEFIIKWDKERESMIQAAQAEANEIVQMADESASRNKQSSAEEAETLVADARAEAEKILAEAQQKTLELETESRATLEEERKAALDQGREEGKAEGYAEGKAEVDRLIQRTQVVLERAQDKRGDILVETEQQIIDLVLLISRKVVKVISENQREVIVSNVMQALQKVRDKGNVTVRVNLADLKVSTEHTKEFIKSLEGVKTIHVVEDSSVDAGGCIIETDFGEVDARISSQLAELEAKILEISPIKSRIKSSAYGKQTGSSR